MLNYFYRAAKVIYTYTTINYVLLLLLASSVRSICGLAHGC